MLGDVAVFTHRVSTDLQFDDDQITSDERETIVFARDESGRWLGVHEHLSIFDPPTGPVAEKAGLSSAARGRADSPR